ncbi:hypothetical protein A2U01_0079931, partial [Trifolium medium]|nr:hypothetical protein [Trifolium medium]
VDGSQRKLWGSPGVEMEEEYSLKRGMRMRNILDGGTRSGKLPYAQSSPR